MGDKEEDKFINDNQKPVHWKFIDVAELHPLNDLMDGTEIYSRISEEENGGSYISQIISRANYLHETCFQKTFQMN
jgi:hypothetical protein